MKGSREFNAPWGITLWLSTAFGAIIIAGVPLFVGIALDQTKIAIPLIPLVLGILGLTLLYLVRGYRLEARALVVRRLLWETRIELEEPLVAECIKADMLRGSVRLFGNGGLFAFCGWFWKRDLGRYRMWATDTKRLVLIRSGERKLVISPDRMHEFLELLAKRRSAR